MRRIFLIIVLSLVLVIFAKSTVEIWVSWTADEFKPIKELVDKFNASQDKYEAKVLSVSDLAAKFTTALAAGNPPDLLHANDQYISPVVAMGAFMPVDNLGVDFGMFKDFVMNAVRYKGHVYGLPIKVNIFGLWWKKGVFKKAGLDPDKGPQTLDELVEYSKKLTIYNEKGELVRWGFDPLVPDWNWPYVWVFHFGGHLIDPKTGLPTIDSPQAIRAFRWVKNYVDSFGMEKAKKFRGGYGPYWSANNIFLTDKLAMFYDGDWVTYAARRYAPGVELGFTPLPSVDGKRRCYSEVDIFAIPVGAKNVEGAKAFLRFLARPENLIVLSKGQISPLKEEYTPSWFFTERKYAKMLENEMKKCQIVFCPKFPLWHLYIDEIKNAADEIQNGTESVEEALETAERNIMRRLRK